MPTRPTSGRRTALLLLNIFAAATALSASANLGTTNTTTLLATYALNAWWIHVLTRTAHLWNNHSATTTLPALIYTTTAALTILALHHRWDSLGSAWTMQTATRSIIFELSSIAGIPWAYTAIYLRQKKTNRKPENQNNDLRDRPALR